MLLVTALLLLPQSPVAEATRIEVDATGAHLVRELRDGSGGLLAEHRNGASAAITTPRWSEPDGGLLWIGSSAAVGDDGATVVVGKSLNAESVTLYAGGDAQAIWDHSTLGSEAPQVAVAARAGVAASFQATDLDATSNYDYEGVVHVWGTAGGGTPDWSYSFPPSLNYFGGGVAVSDDGQVIVAWKADPNLGALRVEAFQRDGTPISSAQLSTTDFHARQARMSDDGSRMYFFIGVDALIYDVASATVLHSHTIGASFDAHAFSGDGSTFAYGNFGNFVVIQETSPGVWTQQAQEWFSGSTYVGWVDLDEDGDRLAYQVQVYSPAYDHIEQGLFDVPTGTHLFNHSFDAPGTAYQLVASGTRIDAAGETVAGISWGDSFGSNPEGFVFEADGTLQVELGQSGSGMGIGLGADGDVFAFGTKAVHANEFGNGGEFLVSDARVPGLSVLGFPQLGGSLDVAIDSGLPNAAGTLVVSALLSGTATPMGGTELDLGAMVGVRSPILLDATGSTAWSQAIPGAPQLADRVFHLQAFADDGQGSTMFTNKVSVRLLP